MAASILVVEDDEAIRSLLMEYLKEHSSLAVDGARDGVDALHQIYTKQYAVIILDVMMPYMTGIDFLDSLEALISDPSIHATIQEMDELPAVIVVTGAPAEQIPSAAIEERFPTLVRAIFRKPVEPEHLVRCVTSLLH